MESNRDEACQCIELAKLYIIKKDLDIALKFSTKANKLFPTVETKLLIKKLRTCLKTSKPLHKKTNRSKADDSSSSSTSVSDDTEQIKKKSKERSKSILKKKLRTKIKTSKPLHKKTNQSKADNSSLADDSSSSSTTVSDDTEQIKVKPKEKNKSNTAYSIKMFKGINKGESYRCLEQAEQYIQTKQYELAEKMIIKSKKMYFLPEADVLLKRLQEVKEIKPYTKEQEDFVKKIKNSENYYTMLDVSTTATVIEIKKAYKKLALLLHPDKNSAPGSGEVFTIVGKAVDILCDQTKRRTYDQTIKKPPFIPTFNYNFNNHIYREEEPTCYDSNFSRNLYKYYNNYESSDYDEDYNDYIDKNYYYEDIYNGYDYMDSYGY